MTDEELATIKARAEAATPGPWKLDDYIGLESYTVCLDYVPENQNRTTGYGAGSEGTAICVLDDEMYFEYSSDTERLANAEFIAHAREDVPALVAEVERLQEALRVCSALLDNMLSAVQ